MPVEYKLMTCLPKAFPVFSPFSFSSRCLYSAYVLLMISSLALSTLSCVNLCPNKCALPMLMMFFTHSCFLCRSILSFGVSTMSPKNSLSFNMSPTSAIIFIKCRNRHHMKNNIRYKGNINNTSVIIFFFLIERQKLPAMLLCLGEPPVRFLLLLLLFISFLHLVFILLFSFIHLLFGIISHPSVDYRRVFAPILYFQPSPSQSDLRYFHFQPFRYLLTASAAVLGGHFLPTGVFLPLAPSPTFYLRLSGPPWGPAVLS